MHSFQTAASSSRTRLNGASASAAGTGPAIRAWANDGFEQDSEPAFDRLGELRAPTVIMVGDKDNPALIDCDEQAAARIPGCELIRMPGVDHYPTVRVPDLVLRTILKHCTD